VYTTKDETNSLNLKDYTKDSKIRLFSCAQHTLGLRSYTTNLRSQDAFDPLISVPLVEPREWMMDNEIRSRLAVTARPTFDASIRAACARDAELRDSKLQRPVIRRNCGVRVSRLLRTMDHLSRRPYTPPRSQKPRRHTRLSSACTARRR